MSDIAANTEQAAPEVQGPQISIVDLQNAIKIIDYACEQGAFKGWQTIEQVISVREKIANFVAAATPAEVAPLVEEPKAKASPKPKAKPVAKVAAKAAAKKK